MNDSTAPDPPPRRLDEERTDAAHTRTLLAEERTYSAWIRTGLASMAAGLAIVKLMTDAEPLWLTRLLGMLLVLAGGVMFVVAFWTYRAARRRMIDHAARGAPMWVIAAMTVGLVLGAAAALVITLAS